MNWPLIFPPTGSLSINVGYNYVFISFDSLLWLIAPSLSFERRDVFWDALHIPPLKNYIRKQQTWQENRAKGMFVWKWFGVSLLFWNLVMGRMLSPLWSMPFLNGLKGYLRASELNSMAKVRKAWLCVLWWWELQPAGKQAPSAMPRAGVWGLMHSWSLNHLGWRDELAVTDNGYYPVRPRWPVV